MTQNSFSNAAKFKLIVLFIIFGIVLYFTLSQLMERRIEDYTSQVKSQISNQELRLSTIAETTSRNGSDDVVDLIVHDCNIEERSRFDSLLGRLDVGLNSAELIELDRLFGRCGSYSAQRKSVMVSRLSREIEVYSTYIEGLQTLTGTPDFPEYRLDKWKQLAAEEKRQSELFTTMVSLQDRIITSLLGGQDSNSDEVKSILNEVRETQQTLLVANKQAVTLRSELISK